MLAIKRSTVAEVAAGLLGTVLVASVAGKLMHPGDTLQTLEYLRKIIAGGSIPPAVDVPAFGIYVVIITELFLAWFLFSNTARALAFGVSMCLCLCFVIVTTYLVLTNAKVGCGCGLPKFLGTKQAGIEDIARSLAMAGVAATGLLFCVKGRSLSGAGTDPHSRRSQGIPGGFR